MEKYNELDFINILSPFLNIIKYCIGYILSTSNLDKNVFICNTSMVCLDFF